MTIVDPVYVQDGVTLRDCTIGPNVSIGSGSTVEGSMVAHSVVGKG